MPKKSGGQGVKKPSSFTPKYYNNNERMTGNNTFRDMNGLGTVAEEAAIRPHAQQRLQDFGTSGAVGGIHNQQFAAPGDQGMSEFDMLQAILTGAGGAPGGGGSSGGGSRGGRSGGGGGGPVGPDPAVAEAMRAYLATVQGQANPYQGYRDRLGSMRVTPGQLDRMFDVSPIDERYDRAGSQVGAAGVSGRERVAGISDDLRARQARAGRQVDQGFSNRMNVMNDLAAQYQAEQSRAGVGLSEMLAANGAGGLNPTGGDSSLARLAQASEMSLGNAQNLFAQSMADRQSIANGLEADVGFGMSQQEQALMSQIAAQRAAELSGVGRARTQYEVQDAQAAAQRDAELWLREQEYAARQAQEADRLRLEAAQLGITL